MKNERGAEISPQTPEKKLSGGEDLAQRMRALQRRVEEASRYREDKMAQLVLDIAQLVAGREDLQKLLAENPDILMSAEKGAEMAKFKEDFTKEIQLLEEKAKTDEELLPTLEQTLREIGEPVSPKDRKEKETLQEELKEFKLTIEKLRKEAEAKKGGLEIRIQEVRDRMKTKADEVRESEPDPLTYAIDTTVEQYRKKWEEAVQKGEASGENPFAGIDKTALRKKIIPALVAQAREKRTAGVREYEAQTLETERKKLEQPLTDLADEIRTWFDKRKILADKQRTVADAHREARSFIRELLEKKGCWQTRGDTFVGQLIYDSDKDESLSGYIERIRKIKFPFFGPYKNDKQFVVEVSRSQELKEALRLEEELAKHTADEGELKKQSNAFLLQYEKVLRQAHEKLGGKLRDDLTHAFYSKLPYSSEDRYQFVSLLADKLRSVEVKVFK